MSRPDLSQAIGRIAALGAHVWRANVEMHLNQGGELPEVAREKHAGLASKLEASGATLSAREAELAARPLGGWEQGEAFEALFRIEAITALLWGVGKLDPLPAYTSPAAAAQVLPQAGLGKPQAELLAGAELRAEPTVERELRRAGFYNWRARTRLLRLQGATPPPGQTFAGTVGQAIEAALEEGLISDEQVRDGDLLVGDVLYQELGQEFGSLASLAVERHYALSWLAGRSPSNDWDATPTNT